MIEQTVQVVETGAGFVRVQAPSQANCVRCAEGRGCGGATFARLFGDKKLELTLESSDTFFPGEPVTLAIEESFLLRASAFHYGLPLICLLLITIVAAALKWPDAPAVIGAIGALFGGFWYVRKHPLDYRRAVHILHKGRGQDCELARPL